MSLELNKIHNIDCLEFMKTLPDKCIDWVITDPPYGIDIGAMNFTSGKAGGVAKRNDYRGMADWDNLKIEKEYFDEIFRISKNQIIFGGNYYTDILPPTKSWLIWDKKTEDKYRNDFADCEMAWCSTGQARVFRFLWSGMLQDNMKQKEPRFHPTQKPTDLMGKIISYYTKDEETIFDPFCGAGAVLIASKLLKRNYIGCEISKEYCDIAEQRIKSISNTLF